MLLPGVAFLQEGKYLFSSAMRAEDLIRHTQVDEYRQEESGDYTGYQRAVAPGRAKSFARYLKTQSMPLVPTAVLLNVREEIPGVQGQGPCRLDLAEDTVLWVIDGQHRIEGFRHAIHDLGQTELNDYTVPVIIISGLEVNQEAEQFRVINETAQKVRTDLARRILAMAGDTSEGRRQLIEQRRAWEAVGADVARILNTDPESPLHQRVQGPNEKKTASHMVKELSFVTSLRPILTTHPYDGLGAQAVSQRLRDYWQAWQNVAPEPFGEGAGDYVLLRTPGIFSIHRLALDVWDVWRRRGREEPSVSELASTVGALGEYASPDYWERGNYDGAAVYGSMKGFGILADLMRDELHFQEGELTTHG